MSHDVVLAETRGPVALLTLNRPQKLNALDYALIDRLMAVLDSIEADDDVRAVVLTGAGERAFSSGADIACFAPSVRRGPAAAPRAFVRPGRRGSWASSTRWWRMRICSPRHSGSPI